MPSGVAFAVLTSHAMGRKKKQRKTGRFASAASKAGSGSPSSRVPTWRAFWPWICLALILLFILAVRNRHLSEPLERDEGEFAYAGQLILEGIPPYQLAYNVKLPGIYAAYAVIMAVFGQTPFGIHSGLLFINLGATVLLFFLARRLFDAYAGVIASATYAGMSTSPAVLGLAAHATHFVIVAALAGFLLLLRGLESRRGLTLFWSGLWFGIAVLMKQHGVFFSIFAFGLLLHNEWSSTAANSTGSSTGNLQGSGTDTTKSLPPRLGRLALFSFGTIAPYAVTCLVLWHAGVFKNFWRWTVVYAGGHSLPYSFQGLARTFQWNGPDNFFWLFGAVGFFVLCVDRSISRWIKGFVVGLLASSFVAITPGFYFFPHYFVLMLPAVSLLVGAGCTLAGHRLRQIGFGAFGALLPAAVFLVGFGWVLRSSRLDIVESFVAFEAAPALASYMSNHSPSSSRIAVFGSEPEIYFYAHRRAASGYIYTYDITSEAAHAGEMKQQMLREVEAAQPEFVVDVHEQFSWSVSFSPEPQRIHHWLEQYLESGNYRPVAVAENVKGHIVFHWDSDAAGYSPISESYVRVYQRNL